MPNESPENRAPHHTPASDGERYRALVEANPASTWVVTGDGTIAEAHRWREIATEDPRGARLSEYLDLLHPEDRDRVAARLAESVSAGEAFSVEGRLWHSADGDYRSVLVRGAPVPDAAGGIREWVGTADDLTARRKTEAEREQAQYRLSLLGEASRRLASSLDYGDTLDQVARLAVPHFADLCLVDVTVPGRPVERLAVSHLGPERERIAQELVRRYQGAEIPSGGLAGTVRAGEPVLVREVEDSWLVDLARADGNLEELRRLDLGSVLISPLTFQGRIFGALSFATDRASGRRYDEEDLRVAEGLARRAAQAIEKARLYDRQRHAARTLQKSLLPPSMPEIPGVEATARYRPAGEGTDASGGEDYEVGGDFYDLSPTPAGWAVVMGDVMGKGVEAAAFTAMTRYTIRTASLQGEDPCSVLRTLNAAILDQRDQSSEERFCTVAYGLLNTTEDGGASLEICRAGHPAPLILRTDATVEEAGVPGHLAGAFPDAEFESRTPHLAPTEVAIFYTDGVTDARNPAGELFGDGRLKQLVSTCTGLDAEAIADAVGRGVIDFQGCQNARDDIAILVLRVAPQETE
jgi:PAS domain S-box-containing protein